MGVYPGDIDVWVGESQAGKSFLMLNTFAEHGIQPQIHLSAPDFDVVKACVEKGMGIAVLVAWMRAARTLLMLALLATLIAELLVLAGVVLVWVAPREEAKSLREILGEGFSLLCFYVFDWSPG